MQLAFPASLEERPTEVRVVTNAEEGNPIVVAELKLGKDGRLQRVAFHGVQSTLVREAADRLEAYMEWQQWATEIIGVSQEASYTRCTRKLRALFRRYQPEPGSPSGGLASLYARRSLTVLDGVVFEDAHAALAQVNVRLRDILPWWTDHQVAAEEGGEIRVRWMLPQNSDRQFTAWRSSSRPGRTVYSLEHPERVGKKALFHLGDHAVHGAGGVVLGITTSDSCSEPLSSLLNPESPYRVQVQSIELQLSADGLRTQDGHKTLLRLLQSLLGVDTFYVAIGACLGDSNPEYLKALRQVEEAMPVTTYRDHPNAFDGVVAATCLALAREGNAAGATVPSWIPQYWGRILSPAAA